LLAHARLLERLDPVGVAWPPPGVAPQPEAPRAQAVPAAAAVATAASGSSDQAARLAAVREELGDCHRCRLAGGRKTIVFGQGSPEAELMFVGEAPGADEDEQGLAFVG